MKNLHPDNLKKIMKKVIILIIAITSLSLVSCGPAKPLTPEEQAVLDSKIKMYTEIFEQKSFVIEANTVYSKKGRSFQMNSSINFVKLNKGVGVVQLGFDGIIGWNGVGGITLDGNVTNYKVDKGDGTKMPSVSFNMNGPSGGGTVRISVNSSGNSRATIDGNFGDRITFSGPLVPLSESSTYQGQTLF